MNTEMKHDIQSEEDVKILVDSFYDKVNKDDLLSVVFNDFAKVDWEHHLPQMYQFWNSLILGISGYKGQPFPKHMKLPLTQEHFRRWLELFKMTIDDNFEGDNAKLTKERADHIALTFQYKLGIEIPMS